MYGGRNIGAIRRHHHGTVVAGGGPTTLGSDSLTRADSSSALGTADVGGVWTTQSGTWGITGNKGYEVSNTNGATATLALSAPAGLVSADMVSDQLQNHCIGLTLRYTDTNNRMYLRINPAGPAIELQTDVATVFTTRISVTLAASGLPTSGAASFNLKATIVANVVQIYVNNIAVGSSYTLAAGEISAFGASQNSGVRSFWGSGTNTAATFDNFLATT